jgi:glycerophosphoryl diester phosphodiesterase
MQRPNVIAHRGASRERPENTLDAFERALALASDGIELDVHVTADGSVVVHHDAIPNAGTDATDLAWRPFSAMTLAEVRRVRVAGAHAIPTLEEVLELVGSRCTIYCELKGAGSVERAAPLLAAHRGPTAMHSFDHRAVRRAAELAPDVPRGILLSSRLVDTTHALRVARATTLWIHREHVDRELVDEVHAGGGTVIVWTVNDPLDVARVTAFGTDGICTDDVPRAREAAASTIRGPSA